MQKYGKTLVFCIKSVYICRNNVYLCKIRAKRGKRITQAPPVLPEGRRWSNRTNEPNRADKTLRQKDIFRITIYGKRRT